MKIFHIDRDYSVSLEEQKKQLKRDYVNFQYLFTDAATGNAKIHFMAECPKEQVIQYPQT